MNILKFKPFDLLVCTLSVAALVAAVVLSIYYVNEENPLDIPFLLRRDTYDTILPFLLGTVAIGGFALTYSRLQQAREKTLSTRRSTRKTLIRRIERLKEIYAIVLACFQDVKLQRRRMRCAFIAGSTEKQWKMRRSLFEEVLVSFNKAQLDGEKVLKTLIFENDSLKGALDSDHNTTEYLNKLLSDLKSQIGGVEGVLRNVLRTAEMHSVTNGTSDDEDLIDVPGGFVQFCESETTGNLSFRKLAEHFDALVLNLVNRIQELEAEADLFFDEDTA